MSILLIADVHLSIKKPHVINGFLHFLNYRAVYSQALYILGDLFETWIGDDEMNLLHMQIAESLQILNRKKVPCYFIHGNHDFLLGKKYADLCKMILLPAKKILQLSSGTKIIILHGDNLCINDKSYQKFKKYLNHFKLQQIFLALPLFIRLWISNVICFYCNKKNKSNKKKSINPKIILNILIQNQAKIIIHGHLHQPNVYNIYHSKKKIFKQIVLGNWDQYGSMIEINEENRNISLIKFPLDNHLS